MPFGVLLQAQEVVLFADLQQVLVFGLGLLLQHGVGFWVFSIFCCVLTGLDIWLDFKEFG